MIRRPPRSTQSRSSAASDVYKRQLLDRVFGGVKAGLFDIFSNEDDPRVEYETVLPARDGRSAELPHDLHPHLAEVLGAQGIRSLWVHQRACWDVAKRGEHIIVTTGTASGKSLCFNLPVLDHLHRDPAAPAPYLYP